MQSNFTDLVQKVEDSKIENFFSSVSNRFNNLSTFSSHELKPISPTRHTLPDNSPSPFPISIPKFLKR